MTALLVKPRNKKEFRIFSKVLKALDADFETEQKPYNSDFVRKINDRMDNVKKGNYITLTDKYKKELFNL